MVGIEAPPNGGARTFAPEGSSTGSSVLRSGEARESRVANMPELKAGLAANCWAEPPGGRGKGGGSSVNEGEGGMGGLGRLGTPQPSNAAP